MAISAQCECSELGLSGVIRFGSKHPDPDLPTFDRMRDRGLPWWWLYESRCTACQAHWLVAQEERFNDIYVLRRLSAEEAGKIEQKGVWPGYFDHYETLLRMGAEAGHHARFMDSRDQALQAITETLLHDRPSITPAEVGTLLNLGEEEAAWLLETSRLNPGIH